MITTLPTEFLGGMVGSAVGAAIGARTGALAGAYLGLGAIPSAWQSKLENEEAVAHLACKFAVKAAFALGEPSTKPISK